MSARVIIHPAQQRLYPAGDLVRSWTARGYLLCTTRRGYVEVRRVREPRRSVVESFFEFAARPQ